MVATQGVSVRSFLVTAGLLCLLTLLAMPPAQAADPNPAPGGVISINFTNTPSGDCVFAPDESAGMVARTHWNNLPYLDSLYGFHPMDDQGTVLTATIDYRGTTQENFANKMAYDTYNNTNDKMMKYCTGNDEGDTNGERVMIRISGLPASFTANGNTYSIYIYTDHCWGGTGNNNLILGTSTLSSTSTDAAMTTSLSTINVSDAIPHWTPGSSFARSAGDGAPGNYVVFAGRTEGDFTLRVQGTAPGGRVAINGIQIVREQAAPAAKPAVSAAPAPETKAPAAPEAAKEKVEQTETHHIRPPQMKVSPSGETPAEWGQ